MWTAIIYNSYASTTENIFCTDGVNKKRIEGTTVHEWGIEAPSAAPVLIAGASTGLTGDYNAKYTYCRKEGTVVVCESNPSDAGTAVTLTNGSLSISWTASDDPQVTHVRIYRTLTDGALYYHDQDVAIGTITLDTTTADGSLGTEVETDHDRPPDGISYLAGPNYNGTVFGIVDNLLYFSKPKQPEYWPSTYFIECSTQQFTGQCIVFYNSQPYFITRNKIIMISGTGYDSFFPLPTDAVTGAQGPQGAISVMGHGIFHVGSDGIYLFAAEDKCITQNNFQPIFRGITTNGVPGAGCLRCSWLVHIGNRLYFGYPDSHGQYAYCHDWEEINEDTEVGYFDGTAFHFTETDDTNSTEECFTWEEDTSETTYDYDTCYTGDEDRYCKNILCLNLDNVKATYYTHPSEIRTIAVDDENNRLVAADVAGYVWHLEDPASEDDDGTAISWEVQSKDFTLQTRAHFPRWVKYDVDASHADCTATGSLMLDGTAHQTHTITGDRLTTRRLVATGNGRRASIKISGTGPVEIYAAEGE